MALAIPIEMTTPLKPDGRTFDAVSSAGAAAADSDAGETILWAVLATVAEVLILGTMSFLITHETTNTNDFRTTAPGGHALEVPFFLALWGELFFGLSGFGIVGPHFLSACNVGRLQNDMDDHETSATRRLRDVPPEGQMKVNSDHDAESESEESSVEVEDVDPMSKSSNICFSGTMSNSAAACFSSPSELDAVIKHLQVARPPDDTTEEAFFTSPFLWRVVAVVAEIWILGTLVFLLRGSDHTMEVPFFLAVWGELFFGLSGFGIVGPHFLSACNIEGMQNDMHGTELSWAAVPRHPFLNPRRFACSPPPP